MSRSRSIRSRSRSIRSSRSRSRSIRSSRSRSRSKYFCNDLINTFKTIINIIEYQIYNKNLKNISNKKRIETYSNAVNNLLEYEYSCNVRPQDLRYLTKRPLEIAQELYNTSYVHLENKDPYDALIIHKGLVVGPKNKSKLIADINSYSSLKKLTEFGIGIGPSSLMELVKVGIKNISSLRKMYKEPSQFRDLNISKGLSKALCKYFEISEYSSQVQGPSQGPSQGLNKLPRSEISIWFNVINKIIFDLKKSNLNYEDLIYAPAGSYARGSEFIGDVDYVLSIDNPTYLYQILKNIFQKLTLIDKVGPSKVKLYSVEDLPRRPKSSTEKRYSANLKVIFLIEQDHKQDPTYLKVEFYGYSQSPDEFFFPYFARTEPTSLQKKIKIIASKKGLKLGPFNLDIKGTNTPIYEDQLLRTALYNKISKFKIMNKEDLFKTLDIKELE
jgi:hypothetical protein